MSLLRSTILTIPRRVRITNLTNIQNHINMSGLTQSSAGTHATRQPTQQEQAIIDRILCNYQLKPSHETYSDYAEDAEFHDPVSIAKGKESIMSQFNGMPKIFAKSITEREC
jgi:hypothetical protein